MNHTQSLCECSQGYNWECSQRPLVDDGHTIELTRRYDKKVYTQVKLCEPLVSVRTCKTPTDWTLLALQSERTGKAHYVVACRCPDHAVLEGPYTHNHPPYARIPGKRSVCPLIPVQSDPLLFSKPSLYLFSYPASDLNRDSCVWHALRSRKQSSKKQSESTGDEGRRK